MIPSTLKSMAGLAIALIVMTVPSNAGDLSQRIEQDVHRIHQLTSTDTILWPRLAEFCDLYPRRLSGSSNLERGLDWLIALLRKDGWDVKTQQVTVPNWKRGTEWGKMHGSVTKTMSMVGLGGSVGTNGTSIRANVLVVGSLDELQSRAAEAKGKIVVWNVPFTKYGETVQYRYNGPSQAARYGAVASLVRSIGPYGMQTPHTGGMGYNDSLPKIPAAAITMEDAMLLKRLQDRGNDIEIELYMEGHWEPDASSRNIIIEIPGTELPNEIVVMGGHIDSWDNCTGAMDDAGGCFVAWRALEHMRTLGLKPKRTIRMVFWTNEENGLRGAKAYADSTRNEKHIMGIESDGGTFKPLGFTGTMPADMKADVMELLALMKPLGTLELTQGEGGADTSPLHEKGIPVMELVVDTTKYFWYHHTEADTPDKIDPKELNDCAFAMAVVAYGIANSNSE